MEKVTDINISETIPLPTPEALRKEIPKSPQQASAIARSRSAIHRIIFGDDPRRLLIVGPCSIHDIRAGREYAKKLADLAADVDDCLLLVMRVYFEKPRTTTGWKGLIMDPRLDGTCAIGDGLAIARRFLRDVTDLGLPTATELLDPITPQYIADFISWSTIGARTSESQTHRQMASGLSMPLGFKNSTNGNIQAAVNAISAASHPQTFLGIDQKGRASAVTTGGNPNCHLILRGGSHGPNYDAASIAAARDQLQEAGLRPAIMIDCSHANSGKDAAKQPKIFNTVLHHITAIGSDVRQNIIGLMLESNLKAGNQKFPQPKEALAYGVSITDACIDWDATEILIRTAHAALSPNS